jgi:hypothetical protein
LDMVTSLSSDQGKVGSQIGLTTKAHSARKYSEILHSCHISRHFLFISQG